MHPEVRRPGPGACPLCGMALEPLDPSALPEGPDAELRDLTRRFGVAALLSAPLLALSMSDMLPGRPVSSLLPADARPLLELAFATPVSASDAGPLDVRVAASAR